MKNLFFVILLFVLSRAPVYGVDVGSGSGNQEDWSTTNPRPISVAEIGAYMHERELKGLAFMIENEGIICRDWMETVKTVKQLNRSVHRKMQTVSSVIWRHIVLTYLGFLSFEYQSKAYDDNETCHVLFIKRNDDVVASCITAIEETDDDYGLGRENVIVQIHRKHGGIPIQFYCHNPSCSGVDGERFENLLIRVLYFPGRNVEIMNNGGMTVYVDTGGKREGKLTVRYPSDWIETNASKIIIDKPVMQGRECNVVCLNQKACIALKGEDGAVLHEPSTSQDIHQDIVSGLYPVVRINNHLGPVHASYPYVGVTRTGCIGPVTISRQAMGLIKNADSLKKLIVHTKGIAFIVNSTLKHLDVHNNSMAILVNTVLPKNWNYDATSNIVCIKHEGDVEDLREVLVQVEQKIEEKYGWKTKQSIDTINDLRARWKIFVVTTQTKQKDTSNRPKASLTHTILGKRRHDQHDSGDE